MRRRLLALLVASVAAFGGSSALAENTADTNPNVDMPFLIAPMNADGKLLGYAYISSKLVAANASAALEIREKVAFIQDAYVRDVNSAPVSLASDPTAVDVKLLGSRLLGDARRVLGSAKVIRIVFGDGKKDTGIQFSPLHPSQTPMREAQAAEFAAENPPAKPSAPAHP